MCPTDARRPVPMDAADELEHPRDAAQWFARMHSGEVTQEDRRAFAAWRAADPEHEREYSNLAVVWNATLAVPEQRLRAMMGDALATPRAPPAPSRRRFGLGLAGACALAAAAGVAGTLGWFGGAPDVIELATRKGERRQAVLPDGSVLDLNSDTRIVVRFHEEQRLLELQQGEAFFDVRRDSARPFVVEAGMGRVSVTGTRFNVRRDAAALQVSVESGSVLVQAGRWWNRSERRLAAGQQAVAYADRTLSEASTVNVGNIVAWQRGKLVFNNMPLAGVIDEMNRYLARPARLDAPGLGRHHVSGVFSVDDPEAMIEALPAIAPVLVYRLADGRVSVVAR